ncbi:MAG: hypothetical protein WA975_18000 [Mesorhizobium sp.]
MDALAIIATTYIEGRTEPSGHIHARAIVAALHAAGIELVHRDENHGPTLERAAERGDAWDSPQALLLAAGEMTAQEIRTARAVARGIAAAIRAMEVKHDG